ncbi:MAG: sugar nucleotide-binding protein [Magnetococcales bacterium]|nr:sugar nucleotide-binding protein [Magnetococcales bacterium]
MKKFLIIGGSGYIGRHLFEHLGPERAVATWYSRPFPGGVRFDPAGMGLQDLAPDPGQFSHAFILHGMTRVNDCVQDPATSERVNVREILGLLDACATYGIKPIFTSSDLVFDGRRGLYAETDPPNPLVRYGQQKRIIEKRLAESELACVVRLPKVYSAAHDGVSLFSVWWGALTANQPIRCAHDRIFSPIDVTDVVVGLTAIATRNLSGIFHLCGPQALSIMELYRLFQHRLPTGLREIEPAPCSINGLGFPETWPLDISMDPGHVIQTTGLRPRNPASVADDFFDKITPLARNH